MKRVVESLPDPARMAAWGLKRRDFQVDAETYRGFAERYRRDLSAFARQFQGDGPASAADPDAEAACQRAFEASLPPYHYHQGGFYRCRADGAAGEILLEHYEREEITGWVGIPPGPHHQSVLRAFFSWLGGRLAGAGREKPAKGKEPPPP